MSVETTSFTELTVYVRLLDEGTTAYRPVEAKPVDEGTVVLLMPIDYDPEDERWEFPPGTLVRCELRDLQGRRVLVAVAERNAG